MFKLKYLSIEMLATYNNPESCANSREAVREALTGERAGRALLPEIKFRVTTLVEDGEVNSTTDRFGKGCLHSAGTENLSMFVSFLYENRDLLSTHSAAPLWRIVNSKEARR